MNKKILVLLFILLCLTYGIEEREEEGKMENKKEIKEKREMLDVEEEKDTPADEPGDKSKLTSGAYFDSYLLHYELDDGPYGTYYKPIYGDIWIIGNEIILHTKIYFSISFIFYYSMKREDKGDFTEISNIKFEPDKTYGFTHREEDLIEFKEKYNFEIEINKPYSLEKWYELSCISGFIDHYRGLYLESLQLNITKVYQRGSKAYIDGKNSVVEGITYDDKTLPDKYYTSQVVGTSEEYNGNIHITSFGVLKIDDDGYFYEAGNIEAYILPKTLVIYTNLSYVIHDEFTDIIVVFEFSIEREGNKITKVNEFDEERLFGYVSNQQTADYLNDSFSIVFEVNKPYDYTYWTSKENDLSLMIEFMKPSYIDIGNRLKDKPFYKRNGKIYAEGVAFVGEEYKSNNLPDDFGPTLSPLDDDNISSHIIMNMMILIMIVFLLL